MPSPYKGFLWRENKESMFWSFHPLADKTNNEHLPKTFFKVIRKSLTAKQNKLDSPITAPLSRLGGCQKRLEMKLLNFFFINESLNHFLHYLKAFSYALGTEGLSLVTEFNRSLCLNHEPSKLLSDARTIWEIFKGKLLYRFCCWYVFGRS